MKFQFSTPIAKVDREQRLISGVVSEEVLDKQGEITDYAAFKSALSSTWPGNIREMHDAKKAVGTSRAVEFDDANKRAMVTAYISKGAEDTWAKIVDGTLKYFSIGGAAKERKAEKTADGQSAVRLFVDAIHEISVVDNGACPTATFALVKVVDGVPTDAQPADEPPAAVTDPTVDKAAKALPPRYVKKAAADMEPWDISQALSIINALESLLASEAWAAQSEAMNGNADDAATELAQVELLKSAVSLVLQFLISEYDEQFEDDAEGAAGADEGADAGVALFEMAAKAVSVLKAASAFVNKIGARNNKSDAATIQKMHDHTVTLGAACAKAADEKQADDEADKAAKAAAAPTDVQKVTHSGEDAAATAATPPAATAGLQHETAASPDALVTKALGDTQAALTTAQAALVEHQATIAAQQDAIAKLATRLETIEKQPMPGGPVTRTVVVDKTLGGSPATPDASAAPMNVLEAFNVIAKAATSDAERLDIAQKKLIYMNQTGQ